MCGLGQGQGHFQGQTLKLNISGIVGAIEKHIYQLWLEM